jgi:hypothetical protein
MSTFAKFSYLVLIAFPLLLMLIMFMAIVAVGHGSGDADFLWILALGILNALVLRNCMGKPYKLRSSKLRWATILLTTLSVLVSFFLLVGSFNGPSNSFITPIMFVVALLTIICGIVVIGDNSNTAKH